MIRFRQTIPLSVLIVTLLAIVGCQRPLEEQYSHDFRSTTAKPDEDNYAKHVGGLHWLLENGLVKVGTFRSQVLHWLGKPELAQKNGETADEQFSFTICPAIYLEIGLTSGIVTDIYIRGEEGWEPTEEEAQSWSGVLLRSPNQIIPYVKQNLPPKQIKPQTNENLDSADHAAQKPEKQSGVPAHEIEKPESGSKGH